MCKHIGLDRITFKGFSPGMMKAKKIWLANRDGNFTWYVKSDLQNTDRLFPTSIYRQGAFFKMGKKPSLWEQIYIWTASDADTFGNARLQKSDSGEGVRSEKILLNMRIYKLLPLSKLSRLLMMKSSFKLHILQTIIWSETTQANKSEKGYFLQFLSFHIHDYSVKSKVLFLVYATYSNICFLLKKKNPPQNSQNQQKIKNNPDLA